VFDPGRKSSEGEIQYEQQPVGCDWLFIDCTESAGEWRDQPSSILSGLGAKLKSVGLVVATKSGATYHSIQGADHGGESPVDQG